MKRPLPALTLIFCCGIFVASWIQIPFWFSFFLCTVSLFLSFPQFKKRIWFDVFIISFAFFLGAALWANAQKLPPCHVSKYLSYDKEQFFLVKGYIVNQPESGREQTSFILKTEEIREGNFKRKCCGYILAKVKRNAGLNYGQELILRGRLYRPFKYRPLSRTSYRDYLSNRGIYSLMNVKSTADIILLNKNRGCPLKRFSFRLKAGIEGIIFRYLAPLAAAVLDAMILGEKGNIPEFITQSMMKTGTVHILVVSGFNTGIVAFIIMVSLKLLRLQRRVRLCLAIPLLIIYCFMTGTATPVARATIMAIIFIFSYLVKREPDIYNSCALAAVSILSFNPGQFFDIGFQLSFASVLGIVYLYPKIRLFSRVNALKLKVLQYLLDGCLISFSAWLCTAGFIAYYFKIFSPVTVLANLLIVPLASLLTLCGFCLVGMALLCPLFAPLFADASEFLVLVLLKINFSFLQLPYAYFILP